MLIQPGEIVYFAQVLPGVDVQLPPASRQRKA
jgi:hypothetical protein